METHVSQFQWHVQYHILSVYFIFKIMHDLSTSYGQTPITWQLCPSHVTLRDIICPWNRIMHKAAISGALHMGPQIQIQCGSEIRIQRPLCRYTWPWSRSELCPTTVRNSAWFPVPQCGASTLRAVWNPCEITFESGSGESGFSAGGEPYCR